MILEVAILNIKQGLEADFEASFSQAKDIIAASPGFISLQLQRCLETESRYILLVNWDTLEAHTEGFRKSEAYQQWKVLLHHFYDPFPVVEHYQARIGADAQPG
jgi:heme-degrading monooxygenase HmoA